MKDFREFLMMLTAGVILALFFGGLFLAYADENVEKRSGRKLDECCKNDVYRSFEFMIMPNKFTGIQFSHMEGKCTECGGFIEFYVTDDPGLILEK